MPAYTILPERRFITYDATINNVNNEHATIDGQLKYNAAAHIATLITVMLTFAFMDSGFGIII
jgi:hypothetical protein